MKKLFSLSCLALFFFSSGFSQDVITKKNGEDIMATVLEVGLTEIKYKNYDNPDGPVYVVLKPDVLMIRYANGSKDIFEVNKTPGSNTPANAAPEALYRQGETDALKCYKGYIPAGTTTLITSLLSPLVGLIPALACSSTPPKDSNLENPNSELIRNPDYHNGYVARAKKIKSRRVWTNWGIGFGVNIGLVLVFM